MVEQEKRRKTSSRRSTYTIRGSVRFEDRRPKTTVIQREEIIGTFSEEVINPALWKQPPHLRMANLPTFDEQGVTQMAAEPGLRLDPKAAEAFIRKHGALYLGEMELEADQDAAVRAFLRKSGFKKSATEGTSSGWLALQPLSEQTPGEPPEWLEPPPGPEEPPEHASDTSFFRVRLSDFTSAQSLLRRAWMGENSAIANISEELKGFDIRPQPGKGVVLETKSLWRFICLLFLESNPGFCANPDCPAPYFVRRRKTQKFCDLGPCTEYAQRRYALKWWHENRAQRRGK